MSPDNNHNTSQGKGTSPVERVFKFIVDYKTKHDGNAPSPARMTAELKMRESQVYAVINLLVYADRLAYGPTGIEVVGAVWSAPPAEHEPPRPRPVEVRSEYTPPQDLEAAQRDARHFWQASRIHLAVIEDLKKELNQQRPREAPDKETRRLRLENAVLRDDYAALKESQQRAVRNWRRLEFDARKYKGLHECAQETIRRQAAEMEWFQENVDHEVLFWKGKAAYWEHLAMRRPAITTGYADLFNVFTPSESEPTPVVA